MSDSPVSQIEHFGEAPFFVFCDHATNLMPADFHCLGVSEDVLGTHIAWDPGALDVALKTARLLGGTAFYSLFSRLLIDPNRSSDREDLIPVEADHIPVPGNRDLSFDERVARITRFHGPYHEALDAALSGKIETGLPFVCSIHSYTPRLMGSFDPRPWHIGLLWRHDEASARRAIGWLRENTDFVIGDNEPYDAREFNYSVDRHIAPRCLPHLTLEIRQDLIADDTAAADMAALIAGLIRYVKEENDAATTDPRD